MAKIFILYLDEACAPDISAIQFASRCLKSNNICDYMLNKPGNGITPSYFDDPFIRLQQWGGNLNYH